jgi:type II secretory pathway component GspD/PulD (secretin)
MSKLPFKALVIVAALAWFIAPLQALEPKWPPGPYKYLVIDQDIRDVLTEFGRHIDAPVEVSDQVNGRLRGGLPAATAKEFLNKLCESYGLVWYFDGTTLHINAKTEIKTLLINTGGLPPDQLTARLNALGIADPRFPVRSTANGDIVSVSGPPPFVALVRQTLTAMASAASPLAVANTQPRTVANTQLRMAQSPQLRTEQNTPPPGVRNTPPPGVANTQPRTQQKVQPPAVQNTQRVTIWRHLSPQVYDLPHSDAH